VPNNILNARGHEISLLPPMPSNERIQIIRNPIDAINTFSDVTRSIYETTDRYNCINDTLRNAGSKERIKEHAPMKASELRKLFKLTEEYNTQAPPPRPSERQKTRRDTRFADIMVQWQNRNGITDECEADLAA
jgi:hypothetical protein